MASISGFAVLSHVFDGFPLEAVLQCVSNSTKAVDAAPFSLLMSARAASDHASPGRRGISGAAPTSFSSRSANFRSSR